LFALFAQSPVRHLKPGETLFRQGEPAGHLYLIQSGRLMMVRGTPAGAWINLHSGCAGELFAEGALFADTYGCHALAGSGGAQIKCCSKETILATAEPALLFALLEKVTRQLHVARTRLELQTIRSAQERTFAYLQILADGKGVVRLERPLYEVASELGLSPESLYRSLRALETQGLLSRDKRQIALT
jgi:CRP-like cAMP-binding protein